MAQPNNYGSWWREVMMMMSSNEDELTMVTVITISIATMLAILWYKSSNSSLPPGPRSLPIVGYLPFLSPDLHKQFTNMAHTYGPIFKFHLGSKLWVVINTPELAKQVVRDHDDIFANRNLTVVSSVNSYGGQDIIFSKNNSHWRNLRKIFVYQVLSNKNLEACSALRRKEVRKTIRNVFSKIGSKVDITKISFLTEVNVLTNMVWDKGADDDSRFRDELQIISSKMVEIFGEPNLSDFFPSLARFDLQGVERKMKKQFNKLDSFLDNIINDRISYNSKLSQDGVEREEKKDFLQFLLDLKDQKDATSLTITHIKAVLSNVLIAGTETTTKLIEWAMANIMKNPNVMKRVQEELEEVVGLNNIVEESHLPKLKYLDATVKETFRLYPVAPLLIPRSPSQDCIVGGYTIPKGSSVFLNVWSIHRDARYWDNPLEFDPDRFLMTNIKWDYNGNDMKFLPFGSGRRLCPGIQLAEKMQMYILASLLHSFDWSLPEGEKHDLSEKFGFALKKINPLIAIPSQRLHDVSLYD